MIELTKEDLALVVFALRHSAESVVRDLDRAKIAPAPKKIADYLCNVAKLLGKLSPDKPDVKSWD